MNHEASGEFCEACFYGDLETVKRLLPILDPIFESSQGLLNAVRNGQLEVV